MKDPQSDVGDNNGAKSVASNQVATELDRNDMAARLNHELGTPLEAIIDFARHLEMQSANAGIPNNIKDVQKAANDLLEIINRKLAGPGPASGGDKAKIPGGSHCDVLHIEDDPINFASVKLLLGGKRKLEVLRAIDGETGIALAQTHTPRLILLDLNLPDIHGSEVIQRLQKEPATSRIPVVVMSADSTPSQIERLLVLGARNYLVKPFNVPALLAIVDGILEETPRSN
jgi:CheY-like chemotaxis protein